MKSNKFHLTILQDKKLRHNFKVIHCDFMEIVLTSDPICLASGYQDKHIYYEFLIPLSPITGFFVGNKEVDGHPGQLIPINPDSLHGVRKQLRSASYILILFDAFKLDSVIRQITGNTFSCQFPTGSFPLKSDVQLLLSRLINESKAAENGRECLMKCLADEMAILLIRYYHDLQQRTLRLRPDRLSGDHARFQLVIEFMQEHFAKQISVQEMAAIMDMNTYYFIRIFKKTWGISPYNFLTRIRIENARGLIIETDLPVAVVGQKCGFPSASRFSSVFLREVGMAPSLYRKQHGVNARMVAVHDSRR